MATKNVRRKNSVIRFALIAVVSLYLFAVVAAVGSFAAYTNSRNAQRTVANNDAQGERFSSSWLKKGNSKDNLVTAYVNDVLRTPSKTVTVCNYESGKQTKPFYENIPYNVTVRLVKYDGSTEERYVPVDASYMTANSYTNYFVTFTKGLTTVTLNGSHLSDTTFSGTLLKDVASSDAYVLSFSANTGEGGVDDSSNFAKNQPNLYVEIIVTPALSTGLSTLRGVFKADVMAEGASNSWTGAFTDNTAHSPVEYDGFNYSISGVGEGTATLSWDDTKVGLSYVSAQTLLSIAGATQTGSSITFSVDSDVESKYDLNFYIVNITTETWEDMNSTVVTFEFS